MTVLSPVAGFRRWRIMPSTWANDNLSLASLYNPSRWDPGLMIARCSQRKVDLSVCENPPTQNCGCGFNAFYKPTGPEHEMVLAANSLVSWEMIDGLIAGFGKMWFHGEGYRAEKAVLLALKDHPGPMPKVLSEMYDVPLVKDDVGLLRVAYEHDLRLLPGWEPVTLMDLNSAGVFINGRQVGTTGAWKYGLGRPQTVTPKSTTDTPGPGKVS